MVTHSTPNSRSAAVTGAGGGLGREVAVQLARIGYRVFGIARNDEDIAEVEPASADANGQHRGSSAQRGTGADRRHRHVSDRRARLQSLRDPASGDPPATTGRASWGLWARPSTTGLPRNSIWAITIRNSSGTRARSAP
jgi:NAD(P)-dependent dehydrogenase (short-subunit alcohol dehydrogenase family)